jgi:hypothetical protein
LGWGKWYSYIKSIVSIDPDELGVYELADSFYITVYYGRGKIKTRLLSHIKKKECPKARNYRFELFSTEAECREREKELLEEYQEKHKKLPKYNKNSLRETKILLS